jgi:hypothetical protein
MPSISGLFQLSLKMLAALAMKLLPHAAVEHLQFGGDTICITVDDVVHTLVSTRYIGVNNRKF